MLTTLRQPANWLIDLLRGSDSKGAVKVTNDTMLGSAAIWYAIQTISGDVAKMPLDPRREMADGRGSEVVRDSDAYRLLRDEPNGYQTADVFKEMLQSHALSWGNGRAYIRRRAGRPVELIPIMPDRTCTEMVEGVKYHITMPLEDDPIAFQSGLERIRSGEWPREVIVIPDSQVLHLMGFSRNGYVGLNIADVARDSFGLELNAQRYAKTGMARGFTNRLMLTAPEGKMRDEDEARKFLDEFKRRNTMAGDAETVGMLREGITASVLSMSNTDAQFIEGRKFSRQDIMLWFGLSHLPGDDSSVSYNSLEQKQLAYLEQCLDRWLVKWEMQCDAKLRTAAEKRMGGTYFKFNRGSWLRTDMQTTANVITSLVRSKIINPNEAREKLDMNPYDGGDEFTNPAISADVPDSGQNPDDSGQNGDDSDQNTTDNDTNQTQNKRREMLAVESKRVIKGTNAENFVDWLDDFYAKWSVTMATATDGYDIESEKWCTDHKNALLEAAGTAKNASELRQLATNLFTEWTQNDGKES